MIISDMRQNDPMTNAMITEQDSAYARAVLVALCCDGDDAHDVEVSFAELERLLETAGGTVVEDDSKSSVSRSTYLYRRRKNRRIKIAL